MNKLISCIKKIVLKYDIDPKVAIIKSNLMTDEKCDNSKYLLINNELPRYLEAENINEINNINMSGFSSLVMLTFEVNEYGYIILLNINRGAWNRNEFQGL